MADEGIKVIKFVSIKKKKKIPLVKHIAVEYLIIERAIISGVFKNWRFLLKISHWEILTNLDESLNT